MDHYERISEDYDAHYNDAFSRNYMDRFVFDPMFHGIDVAGKSVLEAMCGGGQTADYLLDRRAEVTGLDISAKQVAHFQRRHPDAKVRCGSVLNSGIPAESYDIVSVVGGIHHMPPNVEQTIIEIHRVLKPGGFFCFMEPHSESLAEGFRRTWYKHDPLFAKNEAAINMTELRKAFADRFDYKHELYLGNFGYLFVLNSMVFRIPKRLKSIYSPAMMALESFVNKIGGKPLSCYVVGQWQKK